MKIVYCDFCGNEITIAPTVLATVKPPEISTVNERSKFELDVVKCTNDREIEDILKKSASYFMFYKLDIGSILPTKILYTTENSNKNLDICHSCLKKLILT